MKPTESAIESTTGAKPSRKPEQQQRWNKIKWKRGKSKQGGPRRALAITDEHRQQVSKQTWCLTSTETIRLIRDGPTTLSPFLFISTVPEPVNPCDLESTGLYGFRSCRFGCIGRSMADEIPIIPKVNVLEVRTGNIVNWNRLKRKPNHTPTLEVSTSSVL